MPDKDKINQRLTDCQQRMKYCNDWSETDLSPLTAGQPVRILDRATKEWLPKPRSYEVKPQSGSFVRRNRSHLCSASAEIIVVGPQNAPTTVESDEPSIEELHDVPGPMETSHTSVPTP